MPHGAELVLLAVPAAAVLWWVRERLPGRRAKARREELARAWGRPRDAERDLVFLRESGRAEREPPGALDDGTWDDLLLDAVYAHVDRCLSTPGTVALYRLLRTPIEDGAAMRERLARLRDLEDRSAERVALQLELARLGRSASPRGLASWVREPLPQPSGAGTRHRALALAALLALVLAVLTGGRAWLLVLALFFVNMTAHYGVRRAAGPYLDSLRELGRLVSCARRVAGLPLPGLEPLQERLRAAAAELSAVPRAAAMLLSHRGDVLDPVAAVYEYVSIAFLVETRAFFRILRALDGKRAALATVFDGVGLLDALQSAASFRAGMPVRCTPELVPDGPLLEMTDVVHPLLEGAVPNSLRLEGRSCLITGSNMSGKSTFLRAVGLNALLAQTVGACSAGAWRGSLFRIRTSIAPADDLGAGKSTFSAEAERLLRMVQGVDGDRPGLCLVDELLRGTNSVERLAAGEAILDHLARRRALVLVATHDVELVARLRDRYEGHHFTDMAEGDGLRFDYRLRPGAPVQRNAIRLLDAMGFPAELVERARALASGAPPVEADPAQPG